MTAGRVSYLSIVYTGRNDASSTFNDQFFQTLRFNHKGLIAAGVDYDVVFVEWRLAADKPLIADLLRAEVPEIDDRLTTIAVDARYHDAFSQHPGIQLHELIASNVGIRRASGSYILCTRAGIYFSRKVAALFAQRILRPMELYLAASVDLKAHLDLSAFDETVLCDPRNHERTNAVQPPSFTNAAGEFLLLDRFSWHALRGFNEVYRVAPLAMDASVCHRAHVAGILVKDIAAIVYQVSGGPLPAWWSGHGIVPTQGASVDRRRRPMLYDNPDNWGLAGAPAFHRSRSDVLIEFDEDAVPPLVWLRGITVQQQ
jgi:hypothetical protein